MKKSHNQHQYAPCCPYIAGHTVSPVPVILICQGPRKLDSHGVVLSAFEEARETKGMPTAIIAKTVKGKGVSFMENAVDWHGKAPNDAEYEIAMKDLEKVGEALCQK